MPRSGKRDNSKQLSLFDVIMKSEKAREEVKAMLDIRRGLKEGEGEKHWRGVFALPPASLAECVVREFQKKTDIPLELPFFTVLHWVAAYLLRHDISLRLPSGTIKTDLWTVLLASSGAGKTWTQKTVSKSLGLTDLEFRGTGIASSAKFIQELKTGNKGIWIRDEFGQFLRALASQSHMEEIKDYLLRIYDNETIERTTQKYECIVEDTALTILGFTVWETFPKQVSADDMVDGFAQRFSYVIAEKDPDRQMIDYPIYELDTRRWRIQWELLIKQIGYNEYTTTPEAIEGYKSSFAILYKKEIPESFFRRLLWRAHKYALVYHILRGRGAEQQIQAEDYGWAGRVLYLHISDAMQLLDAHGLSDLEKLCRRTEELKNKIALDEKRTITPRDVVRGVWGLKTVAEARAILGLINGEPKY